MVGAGFGVERRRERKELTVHPLPIDHPITPHAFPFARIWRGKISALRKSRKIRQSFHIPLRKTKNRDNSQIRGIHTG